MKIKASILLAMSLLALLIVLPVISTVNDLANNHDATGNALSASGSPLPLPTPPSGTLLASGSPLPLPTPPNGSIAA